MTSEAETMVERIARALANDTDADWEAMPLLHKLVFRSHAKAVLTALLDPTEEMVEAAKPWRAQWRDYQMAARSQFRAMIQAALQPEAVRRILSETPHAE